MSQEALEHAWVGVQHRQQLRSSQRLGLLTSFRSSSPNLGSLPESAMRPGELPHVLLERMRTYARACPLKRGAMLQVRYAGGMHIKVVGCMLMLSLWQRSQTEAVGGRLALCCRVVELQLQRSYILRADLWLWSDARVHAAAAAELQVVRQLQAAGDLTGMQVGGCSAGCLKHPQVCLKQAFLSLLETWCSRNVSG